MLDNTIKQAVWPVMLTPFTETGAVDYNALEALIEWYEGNNVDGLFAVCQSSEMFYLSLKERVEVTSFIKRKAHVPVIASGHISEAPDEQLDELLRIADAGPDAVILLTNRLAQVGDDSAVWKDRLEYLLGKLDANISLGFYECPYPYKRLLTNEELAFLASTGRFRFIKDTCCDINMIIRRLEILKGSSLKLYNANTATLLKSLEHGAAGFSGVMANFHPELYVWLMKNWRTQPENAKILQSVLTMCSQIEKQLYPVNAKYYLKKCGLPICSYTRSKNHKEMNDLFMDEVGQMETLVQWVKETLKLDSPVCLE